MLVHRVVAEEQRSLGLGFQSVIWRLCGAIPGSVIVGALFDVSCEYWQYQCGKRGNCWVYDNQTLSYLIFGYSLAVLGACTALNTATWLTYPQGSGQGAVVHKKLEDSVLSSPSKMADAWEVDEKGVKLQGGEHVNEEMSLPHEKFLLGYHGEIHMESPV